jgi:hypothetical protein
MLVTSVFRNVRLLYRTEPLPADAGP